MNVGLCCCYDNHNYGSMLQCLANYVAITDLGCECEIIRYRKQYSLFQKVKQIPRLFNGGNIRKMKRQFRAAQMARRYPAIAESRKLRDACFDGFCKSTFTHLSEVRVGFESLCRGSRAYDAVVVGSDQLWLPMGLPTNFYNLQFVAPGIRRISYATSFGVSGIPWYQRSRTARYLQKMDFLSVREDRGAQICRVVAGRDAEVVVDPTLLLSCEQWLDLIPNERRIAEPYIFCYFLGSNPLCRSEALALRAKTGFQVVTLRHLDDIIPSDESFGDIAPYDVDPAGFVNLIRNATYVLTDSFHGSVFSIINHKPFATFYRFEQSDRQSRNSRIDSLLSHLGLEDRLVAEPDRLSEVLGAAIDYRSVDKRLSEWSAASWDFLERALN